MSTLVQSSWLKFDIEDVFNITTTILNMTLLNSSSTEVCSLFNCYLISKFNNRGCYKSVIKMPKSLSALDLPILKLSA